MYRTLVCLMLLGLALGLAGTGCQKKASQDQVVIGFVVKDPTEPWFQNEWKFAQQAADKHGFKLVKIGAEDGEKTLGVVDNLIAQGAKGLVICAADTHLGPAIVGKTSAAGMKLMSVDDQLVGADGKPMDVHHLGISASNIGKMVGQTLAEQMKQRGWKADDTAVCMVTWEVVETCRQRTDGAAAALVAAGFPAERIFKAPEKTADVPGSMDAVNILLTQHPEVKHWLVCSTNDNGVMGGIRALEGRGFDAANVVGVGINGTDCLVEFRKDKPTGFWGSVLLAPRRHGYDTAEMMYLWITQGKEPPKATFTDGILITRDTYEKVRAEQGLD